MTEWWTRAQGEGADAYLDRVVPVLVAQIAELRAMLEKPLYQITVPQSSLEIMEAMKRERQEDMGFP